MRQIYLQTQLYRLAKTKLINPSEGAKTREKILRAWNALRSKGVKSQEASQLLGVSRSSLYRWKRRLKIEGWKGLEERSRKPKHLRQHQWTIEEEEAVRSYRKLYPCWGKEKIKVLLDLEGIHLSVSSVERIIHSLKEKHAILEVYYKKRWKGQRRSKRPYAIRKPKDYPVEKPGDIVQIDTLDIHPFPAIHFKHFTARDVVSRWDFIEVFPTAKSRQAKAFLMHLLQRSPFPVRAVQVDGGSEFMAEFERACQDLGIKLFVLPPRSPKLNGCVKRAHRTHLEEFYAFHEPESDLESLNKSLRAWEWVYNHVRPHRSLDNLSPKQYIDTNYPQLTPQLSHMY
jgi:putative transposase